jgi:hypothetical protein
MRGNSRLETLLKLHCAQVDTARQAALDERQAEVDELRGRVAALTTEVEEAQQLSAAAAKSLLEAQKQRGEAVDQSEEVGCQDDARCCQLELKRAVWLSAAALLAPAVLSCLQP